MLLGKWYLDNGVFCDFRADFTAVLNQIDDAEPWRSIFLVTIKYVPSRCYSQAWMQPKNFICAYGRPDLLPIIHWLKKSTSLKPVKVAFQIPTLDFRCFATVVHFVVWLTLRAARVLLSQIFVFAYDNDVRSCLKLTAIQLTDKG